MAEMFDRPTMVWQLAKINFQLDCPEQRAEEI